MKGATQKADLASTLIWSGVGVSLIVALYSLSKLKAPKITLPKVPSFFPDSLKEGASSGAVQQATQAVFSAIGEEKLSLVGEARVKVLLNEFLADKLTSDQVISIIEKEYQEKKKAEVKNHTVALAVIGAGAVLAGAGFYLKSR